MKIGDLVEIGWDGKQKRPMVGVVVDVDTKTSSTYACGHVMVNGKMHYVDLHKLRLVENGSWKHSKAQALHGSVWDNSIKE